jgi:hypothetical protein
MMSQSAAQHTAAITDRLSASKATTIGVIDDQLDDRGAERCAAAVFRKVLCTSCGGQVQKTTLWAGERAFSH